MNNLNFIPCSSTLFPWLRTFLLMGLSSLCNILILKSFIYSSAVFVNWGCTNGPCSFMEVRINNFVLYLFFPQFSTILNTYQYKSSFKLWKNVNLTAKSSINFRNHGIVEIWHLYESLLLFILLTSFIVFLVKMSSWLAQQNHQAMLI